MNYFLWHANYTFRFWCAPGKGSTLCLHRAHPYPAEEAIKLAAGYNTEDTPAMFLLRAPMYAELLAATKHERERQKPTPVYSDKAKYILWDNDDQGFWFNDGDGEYGGLRRVLHLAGRYTAEQVTALLKEHGKADTDNGLPMIVPMLAPNMDIARAEFFDPAP